MSVVFPIISVLIAPSVSALSSDKQIILIIVRRAGGEQEEDREDNTILNLSDMHDIHNRLLAPLLSNQINNI